MHTGAGGVDEHRAGAIDDIPRGDLTATGLQHVFHDTLASARDLLHHAEDGAHRHVHVDVGGAVQRIEQQAVLSAAKAVGNGDDAGLLFRRHGAEPPTVIQRLDDGVVGEHIELLLDFALHVRVLGGAENVREAGSAHLARDHLGGKCHVIQNAGQLPCGVRVQPLLLDDEPVDCDDGRCRVLDHSLPLCPGWRLGEPLPGKCARVGLVGIVGVSVPQAAPHIAQRKARVGLKLLNVPELVQEQFRRERDIVRHPHRAPQCNAGHACATEAPSARTQRNTAAPP